MFQAVCKCDQIDSGTNLRSRPLILNYCNLYMWDSSLSVNQKSDSGLSAPTFVCLSEAMDALSCAGLLETQPAITTSMSRSASRFRGILHRLHGR